MPFLLFMPFRVLAVVAPVQPRFRALFLTTHHSLPQSLTLLCREELDSYFQKGQPASLAQQAFAFEALLPVIALIAKKHYLPKDNPER
jgi:hypothetical protein